MRCTAAKKRYECQLKHDAKCVESRDVLTLYSSLEESLARLAGGDAVVVAGRDVSTHETQSLRTVTALIVQEQRARAEVVLVLSALWRRLRAAEVTAVAAIRQVHRLIVVVVVEELSEPVDAVADGAHWREVRALLLYLYTKVTAQVVGHHTLGRRGSGRHEPTGKRQPRTGQRSMWLAICSNKKSMVKESTQCFYTRSEIALLT